MRPAFVGRLNRRLATEPGAATAIYIVIATAAFCWWTWLGRGTTFFYDEWNFVMAYHQGLWSAMITPHVGQLVAVPVIVYRTMFALVGLHLYWPYRLVGIVFELLMTTVFFVYLRQRARPLVALLGATALLASGQAFQDILWPFELTFTVSLAAGAGALMLLDRNDKLGETCAAVCIAVAVTSSGFGLVFIAGVTVGTVWSALWGDVRKGARGLDMAKRLRRLWVVVPGLGLYLSWYIHDQVGDAVFSRLHELPLYVAQSAGYGVGSLLGLRGIVPSEILAGFLAVVLAVRLSLDLRGSAKLAMGLAAALTFWTLAALARGEGGAGSSRYLQPDGLLILWVLAELGTGPWITTVLSRFDIRAKRHPAVTQAKTKARPSAAPTPSRPANAMVAALAVMVVLAACSNSYTLVDGSDGLRQDSVLVKGDLRAVELAGNRLPANFQPVPVDAPQISVGPYLEAVAALGSPADSYAQLLAAPEDVRASADGLLVLAVQPAVKPIEKANAATRGRERSPDLVNARCTSKAGGAEDAEGQLQLGLGPAGLFIAAPSSAAVQVRLRLFSSQFPAAPTATVPAGSAAQFVLRAPLSHLSLSWRAQLTTDSQGTIEACSLR
jgi:hypothetical protein